MADKVLQTRIALKYDTLENWQNVTVQGKGGNLVLKAGEMGLVAIPTGSNLKQTTPPAVMFKVGDGTSAFKDLPWGSALAADVYSWAKASGVAVEVTGSGNIVSNMEWKTTTNHPAGALVITKISGKLTDTNTAHQHSAGAGLTIEGSITDWVSGSTNVKYKAALVSETLNTNAAVSTPAANAERTYPVILDKNGKLATIVPWSDTNTHQSIKTLDTTATTAQDTNANEGIAGNGKITLHKISKTGNYNDLINKPTIPTIPNITVKDGATVTPATDTVGVIGTISASGHTLTTDIVNLPTKQYVDTKVNGAVQYLGTVDTATALSALSPNSKGDFCRASAAFSLPAAQSITGSSVSIHASDMLVCEDIASKKYAVIHGEVDANTWVANTQTAAGYVAAGGTNYNKVWKTDASGVPGWRDDANTDTNQTVKVGSVTFGGNDAVEVAGGSNVTVTADKTSKKITISATDTNRSIKVNDKEIVNNKNFASLNLKNGNQIAITGTASGDVTVKLATGISGENHLLATDANGGIKSCPATGTDVFVKIENGVVNTVSSIPYSYLSGTPTIPTVYNGALKDKTGTSIFTANQNGDTTIIEINCGSSTTVI